MSKSPSIKIINDLIDKLIKTDTIQSESDIFDYVELKNIAGKIVNKLGNVHANRNNVREGNKLHDLANEIYHAKIPTPPAPVESSNNVGEELRQNAGRRKVQKSKKKKSKKKKSKKKKSKKRNTKR